MYIDILLIAIGVVAVVWYVVTTILIYEALRRRGEKVNFLILRMFAPVYAEQYKKYTREETGKVGPLFYHWILSINIALLVVILMLIQKMIER